MNIEFIRELADVINENNLFKIEYKNKDGEEIRILSREELYNFEQKSNENILVKNRDTLNEPEKEKTEIGSKGIISGEENKVDASCDMDDSSTVSDEIGKEDNSDVKFITSNMIGAFYSGPSPNEDPFVKTGDVISKDDVICVIEAMKLIIDIKSPFDCEIIEVMVSDGDIVEYGQNLFKVREINA